MQLPRKWDDLPVNEKISGYWAAIPLDYSTIDSLAYEIVYVYFNGKWMVFRIKQSEPEPLDNFRFYGRIKTIRT